MFRLVGSLNKMEVHISEVDLIAFESIPQNESQNPQKVGRFLFENVGRFYTEAQKNKKQASLVPTNR